MRRINAADLCRQVRREGRRLGLVPYVDEDGRVFVAEREKKWGGRGILSVTTVLTPICSVDMDHPISRVGKWRRKRYDRNRLERLRTAQAKRREAAQKESADRWAAYRGDLLKAQRQLGTEAFLQAMKEVLGGGAHGR